MVYVSGKEREREKRKPCHHEVTEEKLPAPPEHRTETRRPRRPRRTVRPGTEENTTEGHA